MLLQAYLRSGGTIENLNRELAIKATPSERLPGLVLFKYDQINSPFDKALVRECRGVILDSNNDWAVVSRPFDKFFNYGEALAAPIDWATARVQEKLDGSLMTMYFYQDDWHVASSGHPDAAGNVNAWPMDFATLFWDTWHATKLTNAPLDPYFNYMFELTSPYNMVVVPHTEPKLTLLGMRHVASGQEFHPHRHREGHYFPLARTFPIGNFSDVLASFDKLDGQRFEGYVVVDDKYNRVKVKHPQYVALHHLKDSVGASPKRLVEIIRKNESEEFLTYFPEFKERFLTYKDRYLKLLDRMESDWARVIAKAFTIKATRKEFAALAKDCAVPAFMFQRLDGRTPHAKQFLADMHIDQLMTYLEDK